VHPRIARGEINHNPLAELALIDTPTHSAQNPV
jgi:hypothetical protein